MNLSFLPTQFTVICSVACVLLTMVLAWLGWRKSGYSGRVGLLELLRVLIVALVMLTLNQPEWLSVQTPKDTPTLLVLSDVSQSMTTTDVVQEQKPISRSESIAWLANEEPWKATQDFEVIWESFDGLVDSATKPGSEDSEPIDSDAADSKGDDTQPAALDQSRLGTDINRALASALRRYPNLRGLILASDGDWNEGESPTSAASRFAVRKIPIYCVPAGSETKLPDLVLQRFDAPTFGIVSRPLRLPVEIKSSLARDVQFEIILNITRDGNAVQTLKKLVTIPAMGTVNESLLWRPQQIGDFELDVKLPVQTEELFAENNEFQVPIQIREEAIKVLLIESYPRWEYRYLRNALERDPGVDVSCLLFHPGLSKPGGGRGYISAFPDSREELSKYDVVFLGDVGVGDGQLTNEQCKLLKGLVRSQASGLILMPGVKGHQTSLLNSELSELYPVILDTNQPKGWGSREASQFELTETGQRSLLTKLEDDERDNTQLWEALPGFYWYAAVERSKAGTDVLATHKTEMGPRGRIPLLVTKAFGTGKVLFMGTDSAWRWRKGVEDKYHYRFWGQVARWMSYQRNIAPGEKMRLFYSPDRPLVGGYVTLNANIMSQAGTPLQEGTVTVQAIAPSGETETIRLKPTGGDEWGLFTGGFQPKQRGDYQLILRCKETDSSLETGVSVQGLDRERIGEPARPDVLQEIAAISGGKMIAMSGNTDDGLTSIMKDFQALPAPEPLVRRLRIWSHPFWALILVLLLSVFWAGRKMAGQV